MFDETNTYNITWSTPTDYRVIASWQDELDNLYSARFTRNLPGVWTLEWLIKNTSSSSPSSGTVIKICSTMQLALKTFVSDNDIQYIKAFSTNATFITFFDEYCKKSLVNCNLQLVSSDQYHFLPNDVKSMAVIPDDNKLWIIKKINLI